MSGSNAPDAQPEVHRPQDAETPSDAVDPTEVIPPEVRASTPTATAVYFVLRETPPLTYDELADATGRCRKSIVDAVLDLRDRGVVTSAPNLENPNGSVHDLDNAD